MATAPENLAERAELARQLATEQGFALVGIAPAQPSAFAEHLRHWLAQGQHGQMHYLADPQRLEQMLDPARFVPGAQSIICVADRYAEKVDDGVAGAAKDPSPRESVQAPLPELGGRIARYAWGRDYHVTIKERLHRVADALRSRFPDHVFRAAVDTAPVLEREHAQRAGVGFVGKHTLLIHPRLGSWLLLGGIVTTLPLRTSAEASGVTDNFLHFFGASFQGCGTCSRCIDACPTHCITPNSVQADRCISYLTIEHRGPIARELHPLMGSWVAGCDVCQEVCPFNRLDRLPDPPPVAPPYRPRPPAPAIPLRHLLDWTAADRQLAFRGSALKRIKLDDLRRNAVIAAGNSLRQQPDPGLRQRIEQIAADPAEPAAVRLTAQQVLAGLQVDATNQANNP